MRELLEQVDRHGRFTVGPSEHNCGVAHFLALQYCRTRGFRDMYARMTQDLSAAVAKKHEMIRRHFAAKGEVIGDMPLSAVSEENAPLEHAAFMFLGRFVERVMPVLLDHIWSIGDNQTPLPLLSSVPRRSLSACQPPPLMAAAGLRPGGSRSYCRFLHVIFSSFESGTTSPP